MPPIEQRCLSLERLRADIDFLNSELLRVLEARGRTVQAIMLLKRTLNVPAYDPQREQEMLAQLLARTSGPYSVAQITQIFQSIFEASRELGSVPQERP